MVPVAPFSLINLMAGASSISVLDYLAGTLIGMLPGLIVMSALGHQITALVTDVLGQELRRCCWRASSAGSRWHGARRRWSAACERRAS